MQASQNNITDLKWTKEAEWIFTTAGKTFEDDYTPQNRAEKRAWERLKHRKSSKEILQPMRKNRSQK